METKVHKIEFISHGTSSFPSKPKVETMYAFDELSLYESVLSNQYKRETHGYF